ncbi:MAG: hypothetical protein U5K54_25375 [Cytophagales bacterium]|nr:hypothetical protein [Cytophagales bacterium]
MYRFNPELRAEGKESVSSGMCPETEDVVSFQDYLEEEIRYKTLSYGESCMKQIRLDVS